MQRRTAVERGMTLKAIDEARRLLSSEAFTETAVLLSGGTDLAEAYRTRLLRAIDTFTQHFGSDREIAVFSAPGRTELGGNHTDHQRGHVLAASINLDVIAVVARRTDRTICVKSEGFPAAGAGDRPETHRSRAYPWCSCLVPAVRMSVGYRF